jgi:hypothetical protein
MVVADMKATEEPEMGGEFEFMIRELVSAIVRVPEIEMKSAVELARSKSKFREPFRVRLVRKRRD